YGGRAATGAGGHRESGRKLRGHLRKRICRLQHGRAGGGAGRDGRHPNVHDAQKPRRQRLFHIRNRCKAADGRRERDAGRLPRNRLRRRKRRLGLRSDDMTTDFDALVIGSGISGGWAAKELTEKGWKTLVLQGGSAGGRSSTYATTRASTSRPGATSSATTATGRFTSATTPSRAASVGLKNRTGSSGTTIVSTRTSWTRRNLSTGCAATSWVDARCCGAGNAIAGAISTLKRTRGTVTASIGLSATRTSRRGTPTWKSSPVSRGRRRGCRSCRMVSS